MKAYKKQLFLLPILALVGIGLAIIIVKSQPTLKHKNIKQQPVAVKTVQAIAQLVSPSIEGFGNVAADKKLTIKNEIAAKVIYLNPQLKQGALLAKGTLVMDLDDSDIQLSLKQALADLAVNEANLAEFEHTITSTTIDLKIIQEKLYTYQKEYRRKLTLKKRGAISQSAVDADYRQVLNIKQEQQNLLNRQVTFDAQKAVLLAKITISQTKVSLQQRNLARTHITLPFGGRIGKVLITQDQFLSTATSLFAIQSIEKVVISAQFSVDKFKLIAQSFDQNLAVLQQALAQKSVDKLFEKLGLSAIVYSTDQQINSWQAKVERTAGTIEPLSRTLGVTVSVTDSYKALNPAVKPPLIEGMYMRVSLKASPSEFVIVPRFALREKQLFLVTKDNRLERYEVKDSQLQGELILLKDSDLIGRTVVVSKLFPAIPNMLLAPSNDIQLTSQIQLWLQDL